MVRPCPSSRSCEATSSSASSAGPRASMSEAASSSDRDFPSAARFRARRTAWAMGIGCEPSTDGTLEPMRVTALAGGVGAGKFLRGLGRVVGPEELTVVVNTADDMELHGLHISPDLDSVTYWLAALADRDRGWGREGETFRALEEVRRLGGQDWFAL